MKLLTTALVPFLLACGVSPLLHHETAAAPAGMETAREAGPQAPDVSSPGACPLLFPASKLCASLTWDTGPFLGRPESTMTLRFWSAESGSAAGPYVAVVDEVQVEPYMPDHGHGSWAVPVVESSAPGVYPVKNIFFTMKGEWEVRVHLFRQKQLVETAFPKITL